jgi:hypothetical protein
MERHNDSKKSRHAPGGDPQASQTPQWLDWKFRGKSENIFGRNPVYGRQYLRNRDCLQIARELMKHLGNSISIKIGNANLRRLLNHLSSRLICPTRQQPVPIVLRKWSIWLNRRAQQSAPK